jgi:fructose-1,6-bisphosphatase
MDLLERKFQNDAEAHTLLAKIDAAINLHRAGPAFWSQSMCERISDCVVEHIKLSGDVYDRR